jgi:hypothetical protein
MHPDPTIFTPLLIAGLAFFALSLYRRLSLVALGALKNASTTCPFGSFSCYALPSASCGYCGCRSASII